MHSGRRSISAATWCASQRCSAPKARRACPKCARSFEPLDPRLFSYNSRYGWCPECFGTGVQLADFEAEHTGEEAWWTEAEADPEACEACHGQRLKPEA